jgi:hypothetical protein
MGAVKNHLTKRTRGKCSGEPSHRKNQGKVYCRTISLKELEEVVLENHLTKRTRAAIGEPSH